MACMQGRRQSTGRSRPSHGRRSRRRPPLLGGRVTLGAPRLGRGRVGRSLRPSAPLGALPAAEHEDPNANRHRAQRDQATPDPFVSEVGLPATVVLLVIEVAWEGLVAVVVSVTVCVCAGSVTVFVSVVVAVAVVVVVVVLVSVELVVVLWALAAAAHRNVVASVSSATRLRGVA